MLHKLAKSFNLVVSEVWQVSKRDKGHGAWDMSWDDLTDETHDGVWVVNLRKELGKHLASVFR